MLYYVMGEQLALKSRMMMRFEHVLSAESEGAAREVAEDCLGLEDVKEVRPATLADVERMVVDEETLMRETIL